MKRHRFLRIATAVLMIFSLAATPALATLERVSGIPIFLPGVNPNGTLNWESNSNSEEEEDGALLEISFLYNTVTGKFHFVGTGYVDNESYCGHCYCDYNFFEEPDIYICSSRYCVSKPCDYISYARYTGIALAAD